MTDEFEDLLRRWLRDRGRTDRRLLASVAGHVAVLPPRRPNRRRPLLIMAATLVIAIVAGYAALPRFGQTGSSTPGAESPSSPTVDPSIDCTDMVAADCEAAVAATLSALAGRGGTPTHVELGTGVWCPTPGMLFTKSTCPGGGLPPQDGGAWIGHARVRFAGSPEHAYLNIKRSGEAVGAHFIALATPPPAEAINPSSSSTPEPTPAWASDVVANLECEGEVAPIGAGGSPEDVAGGSDSNSADGSLSAFLRGDARYYATLPLGGFEPLEGSSTWALYGHVFEGRVKAAATFHDDGQTWSLWQVAACDPVEFDPAVPLSIELAFWTNESGTRLPTTTVDNREDCYGGIRLRVEGRLFVADPGGSAYDPAELHGTYDPDADLPPDATDTGYRSGERELHVAADELAVFVVTPTGVERWPRVRGDEYVRIDCN